MLLFAKNRDIAKESRLSFHAKQLMMLTYLRSISTAFLVVDVYWSEKRRYLSLETALMHMLMASNNITLGLHCIRDPDKLLDVELSSFIPIVMTVLSHASGV